ncbi:PREDICTED: uncharacterized protein LOC108560584 [Nicrophorus vespilloides]|uniref:Uncharacterized protein LOC108560584 n=1 Tax=Nicrophorus vespilloides TaxID=110193 RepID=A0ABM1MGJ7_NICVS|nr:PREDICTED: uncharacterized protein LOC108560584 [Nicrophorus vespilloides]
MSHLFDYFVKGDANMDVSSILTDDINNMDIPLGFENSEYMSSDFFDSVLSMEKQNLDVLDDNLLDASYEFNSNENTVQSPLHSAVSSSDNSSMDEQNFNMMNMNNITLFGNENSETLKGDDFLSLFGQEPTLQNNINDLIGVTNPPKVVIRQPNNNTKKVIVSKPINTQSKKGFQPGKKQVIRVQSISGNGRSLLLPVNVKNMKKFKIINANDLKMDSIKVLPATCQQVIKKVEQYAASTSSESVDVSDIEVDIENLGSERSYPPLELTAEEKRLLFKEGIKLPTHYPLTKNDEKELKRIRRKIRNKISAQDSRKRKKEYVDQLEEKARRTDEENEILKKRVKLLNKENTKLYEQLKKLQELLFSSSSKATPTTCLMIVLFSTLLVCLPNIKTSDKSELEIGDQQLISARRALLFNTLNKDEDDQSLEEFLVFNKEEEMRFDEEEKENGTNAFVKYLGDLSKKYEGLIKSNCTEILQGGSLHDFCKKHEDEFKLALQNLRSFMETSKSEDKKFIEPDISDDEGEIMPIRRSSYLSDDDDPPTKKIRISSENLDYDKASPDSILEFEVKSKEPKTLNLSKGFQI